MDTAVQQCAYHEDRSAIAACSECKAPICEECRQEVAGYPVCSKCVASIREEVASAPTVPGDSAGQGSVPQPAATYAESSPAESAVSLPESHISPAAVPMAPPSPARILIGIALGVVAGAIGAFIRAQVMYRMNIQFGLIDSFIGFAVGFAVMLGSGRTGIVPAVIGAVIAFGAITYGWYLFEMYRFQEAVRQMGGEAGVALTPVVSFIKVAPEIVKRWDVMDWVFVAIGVYGGFITPYRAAAPGTASPGP